MDGQRLQKDVFLIFFMFIFSDGQDQGLSSAWLLLTTIHLDGTLGATIPGYFGVFCFFLDVGWGYHSYDA